MKPDSNSQKRAEKEKSSEDYKKLNSKYLSNYYKLENQSLYQKDDYNALNHNYTIIRSELYEQKRIKGKLEHKKASINVKLKKQENEVKILSKENQKLKDQMERYRSKKLVRLTDGILRMLHGRKSNPIKTSEKIKTKITAEKVNKVEFETSKPEKHDSVQVEPKNLKEIKVAIIMDEFSYNSFKYEFNALVLEPDNWREIFQTEKPDLFLCESAWHGINPETKPWTLKISHPLRSKKENRKELLEILEYCQKHQIPSIFWNKEDPTNFNSFVDTAVKFDHVFTSAEECIASYRDDFGHESVHSLMFAAQPRLFNPIEEDERIDDVIFAGSWYAHFPERCEEMSAIFKEVIESGYNLKIYDRGYYNKDPRRIFPNEYKDFVNPPVTHDQMAKVYKESKYAININSVTDSNTMFARRAFELILCNTLVISNYSKGLEKLFKDNIIFLGKNNKINLKHNQEKRLNNLYNVLENHTYTNRFKQILNTINYPYKGTNKTVTIYYQTETPEETKKAVKHYQTLNYPNKKAMILEQKNPNTKPFPQNNPEITIKTIHNQEELKNIQNNTNYFIFADTNLKPNFIKKAILHHSYIENKYGIKEGKCFTFNKTIDIKNTLFNNQKFEETLKQTINNMEQQLTVYTIKT